MGVSLLPEQCARLCITIKPYIMLKLLVPAAFIALLYACQGPVKKNSTDHLDSTLTSPDTSASAAAPAPSGEDTIQQQLAAQDTLFEDGSTPASWENAGFKDPRAFKLFVVKLKEWVQTDNADSIAAHIHFPLKRAKTPADFKKKYPQIFDAKLKAVVASQRLDRIFRNYQGAMIGNNGEIWINELPAGYTIIAIN